MERAVGAERSASFMAFYRKQQRCFLAGLHVELNFDQVHRMVLYFRTKQIHTRWANGEFRRCLTASSV
jgi:hypothetical protein